MMYAHSTGPTLPACFFAIPSTARARPDTGLARLMLP